MLRRHLWRCLPATSPATSYSDLHQVHKQFFLTDQQLSSSFLTLLSSDALILD